MWLGAWYVPMRSATPLCSVKQSMDVLAAEVDGLGSTTIIAAGPCRAVVAARVRMSTESADFSGGGVPGISLALSLSADPEAGLYVQRLFDIWTRAAPTEGSTASGQDPLPFRCSIAAAAAGAQHVKEVVVSATHWAHGGTKQAEYLAERYAVPWWAVSKILLWDWSDAEVRLGAMEPHGLVAGDTHAAQDVIIALRIESDDFECDLDCSMS